MRSLPVACAGAQNGQHPFRCRNGGARSGTARTYFKERRPLEGSCVVIAAGQSPIEKALPASFVGQRDWVDVLVLLMYETLGQRGGCVGRRRVGRDKLIQSNGSESASVSWYGRSISGVIGPHLNAD
jgi:hypothetical protein